MKRTAGRPQDSRDIEALEALRDEREGDRRDDAWPVSWEASRTAQLAAMAKSTPAQRPEWLEQSLRLAQASGALARAETEEKRRRRGLG